MNVQQALTEGELTKLPNVFTEKILFEGVADTFSDLAIRSMLGDIADNKIEADANSTYISNPYGMIYSEGDYVTGLSWGFYMLMRPVLADISMDKFVEYMLNVQNKTYEGYKDLGMEEIILGNTQYLVGVTEGTFIRVVFEEPQGDGNMKLVHIQISTINFSYMEDLIQFVFPTAFGA